MVKPDMITVAPDHLDFPPWRALVLKNQPMFNRVINVFHPANHMVNIKNFVKGQLPSVTHLESVLDGSDWRNLSVNLGLANSNSEWVLFLEQDFLPLTESFLPEVFRAAEQCDVIGLTYGGPWKLGNRLHPAFLLVKRSAVELTSKDFSVTEGLDHFGYFCDQLLSLDLSYMSLEDLNLLEDRDWYHWNGVCNNLTLVQTGSRPNYKPERLKEYAQLCLDAKVVQDPGFTALCNKVLQY